ncbi:MAG: hypothetical protein F2839_00495 [Actinobacteria bacterium]|uniref:Unannotated protein n=1 Tax=freshwater metagenome TaxID=449393 RepID=A0A6J5YMQ5_9ZZZZ|nr:hypothetical protein [Actinomycetota bacterium]
MKLSKSFAILAVAATLGLSGCASGFGASTNAQQASGNGRSASIGDIEARAVSLIVDSKNPGVVSLIATFVNTSSSDASAITGVTVGGSPTEAQFPIALPAGVATQVGYNSDIYVLLTDSMNAIKAGNMQDITITFATGKTLELNVLVSANEGPFVNVTVPSPTPVAVSPATPVPSTTPAP